MNRVKFLNLLQMRKLEIDLGITAEDDLDFFTQNIIRHCKTNWSSNMREIFNQHEEYISEKCLEKDEFTKDEYEEVLKHLKLV